MASSKRSYRLQPNKHVDRELFAELVSLLVAASCGENYVYIAMGGDHLKDHVAIYRRAGLRNLYAFDWDQDVVDRQNFNIPFDGVVCRAHPSGELPALLDGILDEFGAKQAIIWLDYTQTKRLKQLREVEAIAARLQLGDVIRVTMNADFSSLQKREAELKSAEKELSRDVRNAALLRLVLGKYMPRTIETLDYNDMASALAKSIKRACVLGIESVSDDRRLIPVLLTRYKDTTEMLTVTVMMTDATGAPAAPEGWPYTPSDWDQIEMILAPDLSARERLALDQLMHEEPSEINNKLGFSLEEAAVKAYSRFHRFYPTYQTVVD